MKLRLSRYLESARSSLFLIPMVAVAAAVVLGQLGLALDSHLDDGASSLPFALGSTVESARAVLSTVAAATISFAGVAFSVSLLTIQLGSTQYSPRIVHTLFRDPFNKRVMGLVVGTFTFSLIVLRSVRSPFESGGDPVIPNVSVAAAVLLGVGSILAIVAFINHSAHSMDISEILERVSSAAIEGSVARSQPAPQHGTPTQPRPIHDDDPSYTVRFDCAGWVQQIDLDALVACAPGGGTVVLHTTPGRYAVARTPLCTVTPVPDDCEEFAHAARATVGLGDSRTMLQDPSYGLRQLVDVALRALSPGINDPTTAQDAIFHATSVLGELLHSAPPPMVVEGAERRQLVDAQQMTQADIVALTFEEVRRAASGHPQVCVYLLESIHLLAESLHAAGIHDQLELLETEARLVVAGCAASPDVLPEDRAQVEHAFEERFGS